MRRSRLQIRPNIGRKVGHVAEISSVVKKDDDTPAVVEHSATAGGGDCIVQQPAGGESKATEQPVVDVVKIEDAPIKIGSRRNRLKPQVSIRRRVAPPSSCDKTTAPATQEAISEQTIEPVAVTDIVADGKTKVLTLDVPSTEECSRKPVGTTSPKRLPDDDGNVQHGETDILNKSVDLHPSEMPVEPDRKVQPVAAEALCRSDALAGNDMKAQAVATDASGKTSGLRPSEVSSDDDQKVQPAGTEASGKMSGLRWSRFAKATPNLSDAVRRGRVRHPSLTLSDVSEHVSDAANPIVSCKSSVSDRDAPGISSRGVGDEKKQAVVQPPSETNTKTFNFLGVPSDKPTVVKKKHRKLVCLNEDVDRSKLTIRDLIHMNPVDNKMKRAIEELEKKQRSEIGRSEETRPSDAETSSTTEKEKAAEGAVTEVTEVPSGGEKEKPAGNGEEEEAEEEEMPVPQVTIDPDGNIIINQSSLVVRQEVVKDPDIGEAIEERDFAVSLAYGRKAPSKLWVHKETKRFYVALSMVGTDFSLMSNFFRKRTRIELKRKFKREEKSNKHLVDVALQERRGFDTSLFQELSSSEEDEEENTKPAKRKRKRKAAIKEDDAGNDDDDGVEKENEMRKQTRRKKGGDPKKKRGRPAKRRIGTSLYYDEIDSDDVAERKSVEKVVGDRDDSDSSDVEVVNVSRRPTRYGRQPKPVRVFAPEVDVLRRKLPQEGAAAAPCPQKSVSPQLTSPRRPPTSPRLRSPLPSELAASPRRFLSPLPASSPPPMSLESLGASPRINVSAMTPGQLIFITSTPPAPPSSDKDQPPAAQVIHVYVVAPPGGTTVAPPGGIVAVPVPLPPVEQRILSAEPAAAAAGTVEPTVQSVSTQPANRIVID